MDQCPWPVYDYIIIVYWLTFTQVYSELRENLYSEEEDDIALSLTGERNEYAARLRDWLLQVVRRSRELVCSEEMIMLNKLLAQVSAAVGGFCKQQ